MGTQNQFADGPQDAATGSQSFVLPRVLDLPAAGPLQQSLTLALNRGGDLHLEGHEVERISTAALQVLVAAKACVERAGGRISIERPSDALTTAIEDLGLSSILGKGAAAPCQNEF